MSARDLSAAGVGALRGAPRRLAPDLDRLSLPADRRLRLPLGLPHLRAGRLRRVDRVDVPAALRLAVDLRRDARPRRGQLAGRPVRHLRARRAALHTGHEHDRDDLDDPAGLAARGGGADDRPVARQQARLEPHAPADRLRRRPPAGAHRGMHPGPGARSRSCASRCSTTAPPPAQLERRADRRGGRVHDGRDRRGDSVQAVQRHPHGHRGQSRARTPHDERRREALLRALLDGGTRRPAHRRAGRGTHAAHGSLLAHVAGRRHLSRPSLALQPAALRAGAEGADVHAHRSARRGRHHLAARRRPTASATGTTATAGCATHRSRCGGCTRWA